ncbi:MAG: adenine nucleotide alpha hydrolase [Sandaracinaceae bacterium]|nr:adenine nucleotide alpha hydrolase [Sandaracinaceae bacterium]
MTPEKIVLSWSSGKDSAWALSALRARRDVEVVGLLSTINADADRVAMHAVRRELLEAQARATGLPLRTVLLPEACSNEEYEARMGEAVLRERARGVTAFAFGDLFLEDVRRYREEKLAAVGMRALFPLFGRDTRALAREMVAAGLRAIITCVDTRALDRSFVGRAYDDALLDALPPGVDPCGENGEMHTFVVAGPMLDRALSVRVGEIVERGPFVFADLIEVPG